MCSMGLGAQRRERPDVENFIQLSLCLLTWKTRHTWGGTAVGKALLIPLSICEVIVSLCHVPKKD